MQIGPLISELLMHIEAPLGPARDADLRKVITELVEHIANPLNQTDNLLDGVFLEFDRRSPHSRLKLLGTFLHGLIRTPSEVRSQLGQN